MDKPMTAVRQIDHLGRVVIPRKLRIATGIKEGDTLLLSVEEVNGTKVLRIEREEHRG